MRLFWRDRLLAGATTALLVYLLVFQALLAGLAHGSMAAMAGDPLGVICAADGSVSADPASGKAPAAPHCPCATLCQAASSLAAANHPAEPAIAYLAPLSTTLVETNRTLLLQPAVHRQSPQPRAPPALSV